MMTKLEGNLLLKGVELLELVVALDLSTCSNVKSFPSVLSCSGKRRDQLMTGGTPASNVGKFQNTYPT